MANTKHVIPAILLVSLLLTLTHAKPADNPELKGKRVWKKTYSPFPVPCEVNNGTDTTELLECPGESECVGDEVTLTYESETINLTMCDLGGEELYDLATVITWFACRLENSTGSILEEKPFCFGDRNCTGGPLGFTDDGTGDMFAFFCAEPDMDFNLMDLLTFVGKLRKYQWN